MLKVLVMSSGGGTNLQAILDGIQKGELTQVRIVGVLSNNSHAYALERARKHNIPGVCVSPKDYPTREQFYEELLTTTHQFAPDLIVLAGFMVVLPPVLIETYQQRIINIHPSLIPAFCGTGYYGLRVHEAVLKRGVKITGATAHFVDEGTDTGPIILQKAVEVRPEDTPTTLQKRVMEEAEWKILPQAIQLIASQQIE